MEDSSRGESVCGRSRGRVTARGARRVVGFEGELRSHPEPSTGRGVGEDLDLGEPVTLRGWCSRARL